MFICVYIFITNIVYIYFIHYAYNTQNEIDYFVSAICVNKSTIIIRKKPKIFK